VFPAESVTVLLMSNNPGADGAYRRPTTPPEALGAEYPPRATNDFWVSSTYKVMESPSTSPSITKPRIALFVRSSSE